MTKVVRLPPEMFAGICGYDSYEEMLKDRKRETQQKKVRSKRKPISDRVRFRVFERDAFRCAYCGRQPPETVLELDHVTSVADGGSDAEHNLKTACRDCNAGKGSRSLEVIR